MFFLIADNLNLLIFFFILIFSSILLNNNTALHLLLTAEILWITLYSIACLIGLLYDNLNILSLTFFFLALSAVEFAIGLILLLCQHLLTRSTSLSANDVNFPKFFNRFKSKVFINKINWKI